MRLIATLVMALAAAACATSPPMPTAAPTTKPAPPMRAPAAAPLPAPATPAQSPSAGRVAANTLATNAAGLKIIKDSEALRLDAYELGGSEFIGYGHLMKQGEPDHISDAQADVLLKADLASCETALGRAISVPVTANEFSALVSLCYNIGTGNVGSSSAIKALNQGDRAAAADAILSWDKAGGVVVDRLVARRKLERSLFLSP